jgi:hypothetical protein
VNRVKREEIYRLTDEFSIFYCKWIATAPSAVFLQDGVDYWLRQSQTQGYASWAGLAFESICLKHVHLITKKLGFSAVHHDVGPWVYRPLKQSSSPLQGTQIDLLFERADRVSTIAEMKYYGSEYSLARGYKNELLRKVEIYKTASKTKNHVNIALVTPHGLKQNEHSAGFIAGVVTQEDLFEL